MSLSTAAARQLAAQYQSSGYIGKTFMAFASGVPVSYEDFLTECDMTVTEFGLECHDDMKLLREFAYDTDDPVWK